MTIQALSPTLPTLALESAYSAGLHFCALQPICIFCALQPMDVNLLTLPVCRFVHFQAITRHLCRPVC